MFTGIIKKIGRIESVTDEGKVRRIVIDSMGSATNMNVGDSIAIDGCCLTAEVIEGDLVTLFATPETLERTTLGQRKVGDKVNTETSLCAGDPLGGHFVQGHVDAVGKFIKAAQDSAESWRIHIGFPLPLRDWIVEKGSVAVDGISLTCFDIQDSEFSVAIIPHTWEQTNLQYKKRGDAVNLECDILAKQIHQFMSRYFPDAKNKSGVTLQKLRESGF